jgi:hypothetical protein
MTPFNKKNEFSNYSISIKVLLEKLQLANRTHGSRSNESRKLRESLRAVGHHGGLRGLK